MKHTHPIERVTRIVIVAVFVITAILSLVSCGKRYSPLESHLEYLQKAHNVNCKYERGECPQKGCFNHDDLLNK